MINFNKLKLEALCIVAVFVIMLAIWYFGIRIDRSSLGFSLIYDALKTAYIGMLTLALYFLKDILQTKYDLEKMALEEGNWGAIIMQAVWLICSAIIAISSSFVLYGTLI